MSSGSAFTKQRSTRTLRPRFRATTSRNQTRKHKRQSTATPLPSTKNTITVVNDYIPRDQETEVPISSYQPLQLPVMPLATTGAFSKESTPNGVNTTWQLSYYKLIQSETNDTFIAKVKPSVGINGIEILVGGSVISLPKECVKINISTTRISDTDRIVEAVFIVNYNERCNIEKNLRSAVMLARVAVSFAYTYFKIDKFILRDQSVFHCKTSTADYEFSLAGRELLKYGKTWYQRHLNAHIYHPQTRYDIQRYLSFVETKPHWNVFSHYPIAERLKPIWNKSANYKELVLNILRDIQRINPNANVDEDTNINCHLLYPWFNTITFEYLQDFPEVDNFILRESFPFVEGLKVEILPKDDYESVQSLQMGGGRVGWNSHGHWFTERIR